MVQVSRGEHPRAPGVLTRRMPPLPPRRAALVAVGVLIPIGIVAAVGGWLDGSLAVLGLTLGAASGVTAAVTDLSWSERSLVALLMGLSGAVGMATSGRPCLAASAVLLAGTLQAAANARSSGIAVMAPVLIAVGSTAGLPDRPATFALWIVVGVAVVAGVAARARVRLPRVPVERAVARRHAIVLALATGATMYVVATLEVPHGYWVVLVLSFVLKPSSADTRSRAVDRIRGTVTGIVIAIAAVLLLPMPVALAFAGVCLVLMVAWAIADDYRRQTLYGTPVVVLLSSSSLAGAGVEVALTRLAMTATAAVLAVVLALGLAAYEDAARETGEAASDPPEADAPGKVPPASG